MTELRQRLGLDLTDPFLGQVEFLSHLLERPGPIVGQAESKLEYPTLPWSKRSQNGVEVLLEQGGDRGVDRRLGGQVLDELFESCVVASIDRGLERHRRHAQLLDIA